MRFDPGEYRNETESSSRPVRAGRESRPPWNPPIVDLRLVPVLAASKGQRVAGAEHDSDAPMRKESIYDNP
jgi:hypothetical protein